MKKWIPLQEEEVVETKEYKYILGHYKHEKYGTPCCRVSKYIKSNNYFIGHFVIVPEDFDEVSEALKRWLKKDG